MYFIYLKPLALNPLVIGSDESRLAIARVYTIICYRRERHSYRIHATQMTYISTLINLPHSKVKTRKVELAIPHQHVTDTSLIGGKARQ